jgi:hypothetical protein
MGPITIITGILLIALGVGGYAFALTTDHPSPTALIPAAFGLVLLLLGLLARSEKMRMHVMHVAVLIGLVGFLIPAWRVISKAISTGIDAPSLAVVANVLMALICGVYVVLCIKSFIDARRSRKQQATT